MQDDGSALSQAEIAFLDACFPDFHQDTDVANLLQAELIADWLRAAMLDCGFPFMRVQLDL